VLIHDAMGKISWANRGFTEITGYTLEEAMGKEPWSFLSGENTDQGLIATTYQKMNEGQTFKSDNVLLTKDGRKLWISTTFNPIMDENGQLKQVVSIGVDVTGQKQLEIEQRTLLNDLQKMNQELKKQISS
jgi:PAS domain S-box-containing protein